MIGRLRGEIAVKQPPELLLDVNGIGYEILAPMSTFYELPPVGEQITLFTHLAIRDDAHVLYGFAQVSERALFRGLLKVNGVGAKMALAILSGMSADEFSRCVQTNDTASLVRLPGIGKKTAERLIIEMRDRLQKLLDLPKTGVMTAIPTPLNQVAASPANDAIDALIALGYKPADASNMVRVVESDGLASESIIRAALKALKV
jgi:Holliday junction DNA helicase RuvA